MFSPFRKDNKHVPYAKYFRPSHSGNGTMTIGDTRSPRLARTRRPQDESTFLVDEESTEVSKEIFLNIYLYQT